MKFDVLNRWTGSVLFTAEIDCSDDAERSIKLGLAVKWAVKNRANLYGANLDGANLARANLYGANLYGANLDGAKKVPDFTMPDGLKFSAYLSDVVPALLTAGGKPLAEVVEHSWACHDWTNCPMAYAFGVSKLEDVPPLYRARAKEFVSFFDARMIPMPVIGEAPAAVAAATEVA